MSRGFSFRGCTPRAASVLCGAMLGALAAAASGQGFAWRGLVWLLGGYIVGALVGYLLVVGLGQAFGKWWQE